MPQYPPVIAWTREREPCMATYSAEWLTVGDHSTDSVDSNGTNWAKPQDASHVMIQSDQPIRYRIDDGEASPTVGFRLSANTLALIPAPNLYLDICAVDTTATVQRQWVR